LGCDPKPAGGQPQSVLLQTASALCSVYPLLSTLETRGYVCQNFITPQNMAGGLPVAKTATLAPKQAKACFETRCRRRSRTSKG